MNILITGATGFIGMHLSKRLLEKGHNLILISRSEVPVSTKTKIIFADLGTRGFSDQFPQNVDCVIHLAQSNKYRQFPQGASDMLHVNVDATNELLEWSRKAAIKKFIFTSTANVYEPSNELLTEENPTMPTSYYGASKRAAEILAQQYQKYFQVDILRLFTVYGPGQKNMLIAKTIEKIKSNQIITLPAGAGIYLTPVFVGDTIFVINNLLHLPNSQKARVLNVCGNQVFSLAEIITIIESCVGLKAFIKKTDEPQSCLIGSNEKLRKIFPSYNPIALKQGLKISLGEQMLPIKEAYH